MSKLVTFWKRDLLNKLIVAAVVLNAASVFTIVSLLVFTPMGPAVQANMFPTPTYSVREQIQISEQTATAQTVENAFTVVPTITTMPFDPLIETPSPTPTTTPTRLTATPTRTKTLTPTAVVTRTSSTHADCLAGKTTQEGIVVDIVDGNTVRVLIDQLIYSVRYIGTVLPENVDYAKVATAENGQLVFAKEVKLLEDSTLQDKDGVLFRYVIVGDTLVNQELIHAGLALAEIESPAFDCQQVFLDTEQEAKQARSGVWQLSLPAPAP